MISKLYFSTGTYLSEQRSESQFCGSASIRILLFTVIRIRILPFNMMRNLPFNLMRIRILLLAFSQIWTLQMLQNDPLRPPPFHFYPVPDPACHFDADPVTRIQLSTWMRIRIHLLTLMRIRIHISTLIQIRIQLPKMNRIHADPGPQTLLSG